MKTILLSFLLITGSSFAQNNYTLQKNTGIYDLPGGEFLTALIINDKTFIQHYDSTGNIIWEDSLLFFSPITPVYFNEIARFKNTNEYIISAFADLSPDTPFWQSFSNDTLVYQFSKLDLSIHQFTEHRIDTFSCKSVDLIELKDTSIYLLVADNSVDNNPFNHVTYSLNSSMDISLIAPLDSVTTYPFGWSTAVYGDSIYKHQSFEGYHIMYKYSSQMSTLQSDWNTFYTAMNNSIAYGNKIYNNDSMFIFTEGTSSGSWVIKWRMDWVNLSLSTINSLEFNSPATDISPLRYESWFNNSVIDKINRKIIILTRDNGPIPSNILQKIFIYDFDFNLVCEFPVNIGNQEDNSLIELNDLVYLRNDNSSNTTLTRIDCSILKIDENDNNNDFDVYPNPASSIIYLPNPLQKTLMVSLTSSDGKEIIKLKSQDSSISINPGDMPAGIYFLHINDGTKTYVERVIKE